MLRLGLTALFLIVSICSVSASDNYDSLTHTLMGAIIARDSSTLAALMPRRVFCFPLEILRTEKRLPRSPKNFVIGQDGYYRYEKKFSTVTPGDEAAFLTSGCPGDFSRDAYPVVQSDFSQVNIVGKNRVEIVCRALCTYVKVHLVFVRNRKSLWNFAGVFWEGTRTEDVK